MIYAPTRGRYVLPVSTAVEPVDPTETSNLVYGFVWRMTSRRTKISPKSGRGLGHVTPTIFGSTVGYPSDSLASCYYQGWHVGVSERGLFSSDKTVM